MAARLGNVLYWLCFAIAALALACSAYLFVLWFMVEMHGEAFVPILPYGPWVPMWAFIWAGAGVGIWTLGWACRYVLGGR